MPQSLRLLSSLTFLTIAAGAMILAVPGLPGFGPAPDALDFLTRTAQLPAFFVPAALGLAFYVFAKSRPPPQAVMRAAHLLPPVPAGLSKPERLAKVRATFNIKSHRADGLVLADLLVHAAQQTGASDIHVQPGAQRAELNLRIDGALETFSTLAPAGYAELINRLKVLGRLVHHVSDKPQDGQFSLPTPEGVAEVRLSLIPTQHGEKAVLRLAGFANELPRLDALRLPDSVYTQLTRLLEKPHGLIFFTGPTGSGKTTSIYASIHHLKDSRGRLANIATIEDPIEYSLPGASQTQVNRATGLDFAQGLRALLRQDPNVLVVGEIRDTETARIATQAALTGHLILTTVHAASAPGVFNRLLEMGVEPSVLSSVALACFSQRLLRRLCPFCRQPAVLSDTTVERLTALGEPTTGYFASDGCDDCGGTGIGGRIAVFEVLVVSDEIREALRSSPSNQQLMELAKTQGMLPLRESGAEGRAQRRRVGDGSAEGD